jgi:hypothetical protein
LLRTIAGLKTGWLTRYRTVQTWLHSHFCPRCRQGRLTEGEADFLGWLADLSKDGGRARNGSRR